MQRTSVAIAMVAASLVIVSHLDAYTGHLRHAQKQQDEVSLNVSSHIPTQILWDTPSKFAMRWDDARKKMLFDRKATCVPVRCNVGICVWNDPGPAADCTDEYSFDVRNIGNSVTSSDSPKPDGQIHYGMEWDNAGEQLVSPKPAGNFIKEMFNSQVYVLWGGHNAEGGPKFE
jgi:hypothetical protein